MVLCRLRNFVPSESIYSDSGQLLFSSGVALPWGRALSVAPGQPSYRWSTAMLTSLRLFVCLTALSCWVVPDTAAAGDDPRSNPAFSSSTQADVAAPAAKAPQRQGVASGVASSRKPAWGGASGGNRAVPAAISQARRPTSMATPRDAGGKVNHVDPQTLAARQPRAAVVDKSAVVAAVKAAPARPNQRSQ